MEKGNARAVIRLHHTRRHPTCERNSQVPCQVRQECDARDESRSDLGMGMPAKAQAPSGPCVFYAVAKAVRKSEDFFIAIPSQASAIPAEPREKAASLLQKSSHVLFLLNNCLPAVRVGYGAAGHPRERDSAHVKVES